MSDGRWLAVVIASVVGVLSAVMLVAGFSCSGRAGGDGVVGFVCFLCGLVGLMGAALVLGGSSSGHASTAEAPPPHDVGE